MEVHDIAGDCKVWEAVPSFVAAVVGIVIELAWETTVQSLAESVVGRFHLLVDHTDRMDLGLDICVVLPAVAVRLVEATVVIVTVN